MNLVIITLFAILVFVSTERHPPVPDTTAEAAGVVLAATVAIEKNDNDGTDLAPFGSAVDFAGDRLARTVEHLRERI